MEIFYGYGLTVLETVFILAGLLILHSLRKLLGQGPLLFALGMLIVFTQIAGAGGLFLNTGIQAVSFPISSTVLTIPFLAILIVVYAIDGTLAAQRLIIGLILSLGFYLYLASVTKVQCAWPGNVISQGPSADMLAYLLQTSLKMLGATTLAASVDLILLPIFYQRLVNLKCNSFLAVAGTLFAIEIIDHIVFVTATSWGTQEWWREIASSYLTRGVFIVILSIPTSIYLNRIRKEAPPGESRRTLDILLAFFGAYGKSLQLEETLRASEARYRLLVQNASDMIVIMNSSWEIIDANHAALDSLGFNKRADICHLKFADAAGLDAGVRNWLSEPVSDDTAPFCAAVTIPRTGKELELTVNVTKYSHTLLIMLLGRDVTERKKLEKEREEWNIKLSHMQRLEAIGRLAGGIAHDFNNYLHAIQGHLDIIRYMHEIRDKGVERNLEKIDHITTLAAKLTSQMLSFARKANYQLGKLELRDLAEHCAELFLPGSTGFSFNLSDDRRKHFVMGDFIQLQQTVMNLMINARDAMKDTPEEKKRLDVYTGSPEFAGITLEPPPDVKYIPGKKYAVIRVLDHGTGIAPETKGRLFEPFFTTKPVGEGTGMGLAMAYGTVVAHNGWIQCSNQPGAGAAFDVILPELDEEDNPQEPETKRNAAE